MADLEIGTYIVYSVGASKVLDVKGGSDQSGTDVQVYTRNNTDAQIWAFVKPNPDETSFQIICSLTGKCLDVSNGTFADGTKVIQYNDNNSNAQRWAVTDTGSTATVSSVTYPVYKITPATSTSLSLDASDTSALKIKTSSSSDNQKWVCIPVSALTSAGTYEIVLASDTTMCFEVASGSTANGANIQVASRNNSDQQVFRTDVSSESLLIRFFNAGSEKVFDVKGGAAEAGTNIQQYAPNNTAAQNWLPVQNGSVKIDGQTVPTYEIRAQVGNNLVMDCKGGGKTAKTNIQLYTKNDTVAQKFAFVKTERIGDSINAPSTITPTTFSREGNGDISVTGLSFVSNDTKFQARYCVKTYSSPNMTSYTTTEWMNVKDDSTSRSGWGDAWTYTFERDGNDPEGIVNLPFTKTVMLNSSCYKAELVIEVRAFEDNYGTGYKAHGNETQTVISLVKIPSISLSSIGLSVDSATGLPCLVTKLANSLSLDCEFLRARVLGSGGDPITEYAYSSSMTVSHLVGYSLKRLPTANESITIEYMLRFSGDVVLNGTLSTTFSYGTGPSYSSDSPAITYTSDGSFCADVTAAAKGSDYCLMVVPDLDGTKLVSVPLVETSNGVCKWRAVPPLNQTLNLYVLAATSSAGGWTLTTLSCIVKAHQFMWNWTERSVPYNTCATLFLNNSAPPNQTRSYTSDISFNSPAGRIYPVASAGTSLEADLSVEGIVVDPDANYVASGPLPSFSTLNDISKLIKLSGRGIHPIYRTPYGDWHIVGIESVNKSKNAKGLSNITVKQRAVEE